MYDDSNPPTTADRPAVNDEGVGFAESEHLHIAGIAVRIDKQKAKK